MTKNVLVIGSGGIGCELIKLLIQKDKVNLTLIDFDTIEISNLNRQFLFSEEDVGNYKSKVVIDKVKAFNKDWTVNFIVDNIKNYDLNWFKQFDIVYNCLDNNDSRKHVNLMCYLCKIVLIDGGSGGFKGQSCYFDYKNECFDCLPKPVTKRYHVCTIRGIPTKFEHCIEFVKSVIFQDLDDPFNKNEIKYYKKVLKSKLELNPLEENSKKDIKKIVRYIKQKAKKEETSSNRVVYSIVYNKEDYKLNRLLYKLACIRAKSANIEIIPFFEAQTIANNIISSICSTNAIVASIMLLSERNKMNYFLGTGKNCIMKVEPNEKNVTCDTCSVKWIIMTIKTNCSVKDLFDFLKPYFDCRYFIDSELNSFSSYSYNLHHQLTANPNTISTIGLLGEEIIKIYVLNVKEEFKIY